MFHNNRKVILSGEKTIEPHSNILKYRGFLLWERTIRAIASGGPRTYIYTVVLAPLRHVPHLESSCYSFHSKTLFLGHFQGQFRGRLFVTLAQLPPPVLPLLQDGLRSESHLTGGMDAGFRLDREDLLAL